MSKYTATFVLIFVVAVGSAFAQRGPQKGMAWRIPNGMARAQMDLQQMSAAGVEAVRTDVVRRSELLALADTIGIDVYVDLPISRLPASRLMDTLQYASAVLDTVLGLAQVHPSLRNIGLARHADTSDSTACAYFDRLASYGRARGPAGVRFYYATRFIEDDVCADEVDFVLIDVRDRKDPILPLRSWTAAGGNRAPAGIGALGMWVRGDTLEGLNVPASPQRQARYFEDHLPVLLSDTLSADPPAVFVFRWRDRRLEYPSTAYDVEHPYVQRYGLHTVEGRARPAMDVVRGIYTGRQTVFAFEQGNHVPREGPWTTLVGWGVMLMLGVFYAASPRFRHMVPRYFQAHVFFLESVREGRDVLFGASTVLLTALGVSCGVVVTVVLDAVRQTDAFVMAVRWLPESAQQVITTLLASPFVLTVLAGCIYVIALLVWTVVLALVSKRKYRISSAQALMLVVWTRWPLLFVLVGAIVIAASPGINMTAIAVLTASWALIELGALGRALFDLVVVSRIPIYLVLPCLLLHPGVIVLGIGVAAGLSYQPELTFLWHTLTRT